MVYVIFAILGFAIGGVSVYIVLEAKRKSLQDRQRLLDESTSRLNAARVDFESQSSKWTSEANARYQTAWSQLQSEIDRVGAIKKEYEERTIAYQELQSENSILKRDLRNLDLHLRKVKLDSVVERNARQALEGRIKDIGSRYLKENIKWIGASLNPNNFASCKQRLMDVIERCRGIEFEVSSKEEAELVSNLKSEYEMVVREAFAREEQTRIKAQIREEQLRQREIDRELNQLEREREAIKIALEKALREAADEHSEEVQRLRARLAEAEERSQRAIAQAQLTKAGFVYVLSNIGSFGDGVFKVGMSRRLDPYERVRELGSASVPFPYDVHMMISCDDAPSLENALHRALHRCRINKANPRKEFFKTNIETIIQIVREHHGEVEFIADAEALQFRQSREMSVEDQEYIESVYDQIEDEETFVSDEV